MSARPWLVCIITGLLLAQSLSIQAQGKSPISVPAGTTVNPVKFGEDQEVVLKPGEQVAFLFICGIWGLEDRCLDKDFGPGRLFPLRDLVQGVKAPDGGVIKLSVDPFKDTNYRYDVMVVGDECVVWATPRVPGLGAFARIGSPKSLNASFYYNPKGADLTRMEKLSEYGYGGNGFLR